MTEDRSLWRKFITQKYGLTNSWTTEELKGAYERILWKTIRNMWPKFWTNIGIKVGDGVKASFQDN